MVSGQSVASRLGQAPLEDKYLVVRDVTSGPYGYVPIPSALRTETPLWYYVLAEAQRELMDLWLAKNGGEPGPNKLEDDDLLLGPADTHGDRSHSRAPVGQLGPVGGMILLETFFGLLLADGESYMTIGALEDHKLHDDWFAFFTQGGAIEVSMWRLLEVAGLT